MASAYFSFGGSRIHYSYWGTGKKLLLCFHGYGESSDSFAFLEEHLGEHLTILAIDLPYHGGTEWHDEFYLDPHDLLSILNEIIAGLPCDSAGWWVLGYSMGGRVALQLLQLAPEKIRRMVLLAPDGLQMNPWYWLATQTSAGNRLFRWTMQRPAWLFFLLKTGHLLRLVNPSIYKFTAHYVDDQRVREILYARWTTMRGFRPSLAIAGGFIRQYEIPIELLYGSYDRIIRWERGERFRRANPAFCNLTLLPAGHQLLQAKFLEVIAKALYLPTN
jgi:pimeloyl-ACP methyl ester carboxylesterase